MAEIFTFPDIDEDRNEITIIRTPRSTWSDPRIERVLAAFGMKEQARRDDAGSRLVVRDALSELEVFRTSDSLRWTRLTGEDQEPAEPPRLPTDEEAIRLADEQLAGRGLADDRAALASVTLSHHSRIGQGNRVLANYPVAKHVNYQYTLNGLPVFGPGAKIQVTFAGNSQLAQMYRFWRQPPKAKPSRRSALRTPSSRFAVIRRSARCGRLVKPGSSSIGSGWATTRCRPGRSRVCSSRSTSLKVPPMDPKERTIASSATSSLST